MVWYGMVGPDQSLAIIMVGPLGRVGQRLLLRVVLLAPNQIRLILGPRIPWGVGMFKVKVKVKVGAKLNRFRFALGRKIPSL